MRRAGLGPAGGRGLGAGGSSCPWRGGGIMRAGKPEARVHARRVWQLCTTHVARRRQMRWHDGAGAGQRGSGRGAGLPRLAPAPGPAAGSQAPRPARTAPLWSPPLHMAPAARAVSTPWQRRAAPQAQVHMRRQPSTIEHTGGAKPPRQCVQAACVGAQALAAAHHPSFPAAASPTWWPAGACAWRGGRACGRGQPHLGALGQRAPSVARAGHLRGRAAAGAVAAAALAPAPGARPPPPPT
jgi:hypothetical protein